MKSESLALLPVTLLILLMFCLMVQGQQSAPMGLGLNRIEGRVMDSSNLGVNNVYVELYDNVGSLISRQRSSGQGRFSFRGMGPGRYTITVKPYGTNFLEDSREIEINNQFSRSDTVMVDFRLRPDNRFRPEDLGIVGTVFAQEVPEDARRRFKAGVENFRSDPVSSVADLEMAIKIFPTYFDALAALGKIHVIKGKYSDGYPYLLRAIDINTKCSDCYYSLSLAFYKLGEMQAALKAVDAAVVLQPQNNIVRLLQGIIYRSNKDYTSAEKALLAAKALSKDPVPEIHWQLSLLYNRTGRNSEAASELESYLKSKNDLSKDEKQQINQLIAKLRQSRPAK